MLLSRGGDSAQAVGTSRKQNLDSASKARTMSFAPADRIPTKQGPRQCDQACLPGHVRQCTHWSTRSADAVEGLSGSTMSSWFRLCRLKPHLTETVKSPAVIFIETVRDIGGPYVNDPDHATVLCFDKNP